MMGIANKFGPARFILMGAGAAMALAIGAPTDAASETPAVALKLAKEYKVSPELMSRWEGEHKVP
ncbi:MAG: hypothetical protein HN565_06785, partial [Rhodospirillales bacterium]|nr:hypothetical protein [Rhodospirillales bacterium]